jgi:endoglucanase
MELVPQANWVTKGTSNDARKAVQQAVALATVQHAIPVLVAYNIPGRDCAFLSAGGATTEAEYKDWISGFAQGIGNAKAVVILEPDGLGLLPEGCGDPVNVPQTNAERFREMNFAVDTLEAQPNAIVYLDGTHSAWLNAHDNATRLIQAGVQRAQGFFLNVSNFQYTPNQVQYGTWVSNCIAATLVDPNATCPDQYYNGGPLPALIAQNFGPFGAGGSLSPYGIWSDTDPTIGPDGHSMPLNSGGENVRWANSGIVGTTHFVVDTSRNGQGPWNFATAGFGDAGTAQDWCNPPNRGLGVPPKAQPVAGNSLVDAWLWIKTPGESDGQCTRGTGPPPGTDPVRHMTDPAAGSWFPEQALELAHFANPAL